MKKTLLAAALLFAAYSLSAQAQDTAKPKAQGKSEMSEAVGDAWITTKVKSDLLATKDVSGTAVEVDTVDGKVTLRGTVKTQAEADKAVSVAKGIKGVTDVKSEIQVEAAPAK